MDFAVNNFSMANTEVDKWFVTTVVTLGPRTDTNWFGNLSLFKAHSKRSASMDRVSRQFARESPQL